MYVTGMKILTASQLREADSYTIQNEPIASIDLMERASTAFVWAFSEVFAPPATVSLFCGVGNNGGDGLVIARLLKEVGWDVEVFLVHFSENISEDNKTNQNRLIKAGITIHHIESLSDFPEITGSVIIDALVGTGISRPLEGLLGETVRKINTLDAVICSVDLPSGLFDQGDCTEILDRIVHADFTFTFQSPKINFLFPEYAKVIGSWVTLDIGLHQEFIDQLSCNSFLLEETDVRKLIRFRDDFDHKGTFGHAGIVAGSYGMLGAAVLSSKACLRSGAGLTTIFAPSCGYEILQATVPEAMCQTIGDRCFELLPETEKISALGIGPGIGQDPKTIVALNHLLDTVKIPCILDADALNILATSDNLSFQQGTIITPHLKEFDRLFGSSENSNERFQKLKDQAQKHDIYIVLKGRYSAIACPDGSVYFNPTGNPGMATGGSGDVLTGILTGLLAQGYSPKDTCILGCYLHGLAGDFTADALSENAMIASDIIEYLPQAFLYLSE